MHITMRIMAFCGQRENMADQFGHIDAVLASPADELNETPVLQQQYLTGT